MYPKEEILRRLKMVSWDLTYSPEQLYPLLIGESNGLDGISRAQLYAKIVNSFNWHTVRKIIPESKLSEALSDEALVCLFPKSFREKYRNVRRLL